MGRTAVTQTHIDTLHQHGFTDAEIFDITTTAAARCSFSKTLDALGAEPDEAYMALDKNLRQALTVGRPIYSGREKAESEKMPPVNFSLCQRACLYQFHLAPYFDIA